MKSEKDEADYLKRYLGDSVDEYRHARFFAMGMILHVYYFVFFLLSGFTGKPIGVNNFDHPGFRTFHDRIWNGETNLADNDTKLQYAWVHREEFLRKMTRKHFNDSLRIVSRYHEFH